MSFRPDRLHQHHLAWMGVTKQELVQLQEARMILQGEDVENCLFET